MQYTYYSLGISCGEPVPNGDLVFSPDDPTQWLFEDFVNYTCPVGEIFDDDDVMKQAMCQAHREWEPVADTCIGKFKFSLIWCRSFVNMLVYEYVAKSFPFV